MSNKKFLVPFIVLLPISISRLVMSPTIQSIRVVDITMIFATGMLAGALLVATVQHLRTGRTN